MAMVMLSDELGFPYPIEARAHEAVLSIFVTASLLGKEADRVLQAFGLTQAQFDILMLLRYQTADGSADQTSLGKMLVVNRSNVTALVDRMERDGLVTRTGDPADRRVKRVRMTPAAARLLERAEQAYSARTREVVAGLTPAKLATLCRLLQTVRTALREGRKPRGRRQSLTSLAQDGREP
jgi:DNA-binding MarR family transcriptional regulator